MTPRVANREGTRRLANAAFGGAGGLALVGLLVLLAPIAAAAPASFQAPFSPANAVQTSKIMTHGAHASVALAVPPTFLAVNGQMRLQVLAQATGVQNTLNLAGYHSQIGVQGLSFVMPVTGPHQIRSLWVLGFQAALQTKGVGTGFVPGMSASLGVHLTTYLVEQVSGKVVTGSQVTVQVFAQNVIQSGFVHLIPPTSMVVNVPPVVLLGGTVYQVVALLTVDLTASVGPMAPAGATATSQILLTSPASALRSVLVT